MIPKGNQRGGGQNLATHLMNSYDNDVEVAEVRGAVAQDLHGAFAEWRAQAKTTNCEKYLYSLSLNPDHRQGPFERAHYIEFFDRTEKKMGLANQPRAVVFHTKDGREHAHCVWSRIDTQKMKAVQLSHDRQKLRTVAQDFARDHGITLPEGMQRERGKERFKDRQKSTTLAENQQKERTGETKQQRCEAITKAWQESDNAQSFAQALEAKGYHLARGDKRGAVVVDRFGEVHSLSRQVTVAKAKDIQARLGDMQLSELAEAHKKAKQYRARHDDLEKAKKQEAERRADIDRRRDRMIQEQDKRRQQLQDIHTNLTGRHAEEVKGLFDLHRQDEDRIAAFRAANQPKGMKAFLFRITGLQARAERRQQQEAKTRQDEQQRQVEALKQRHERELHEMQRRQHALDKIAQRERASFETALKREEFQKAAESIYQVKPEREKKLVEHKGLTKEFAAAQERHEPHKPEGKEKQDLRASLRGVFARVADRLNKQETQEAKAPPQEQKSGLSKAFADAQARHEPHKPEGKEREDLKAGLRADFNTTAAQQPEKTSGEKQARDAIRQDLGRSALKKDEPDLKH